MRHNGADRAREATCAALSAAFDNPLLTATALPAETRLPLELEEDVPKVTQMFLGIPTHPTDPPAPVLRVSHYLRDIEFSSSEGSVRIPGRHARFSIWPDDRPVCAMSLSEEETKRLGRFLLSAVPEETVPEPHE